MTNVMSIAGKVSDGPALPRLAYSMRETAGILGVNYQTVYRLNKRGLLKSAGGLRTKLFPVTEIERFLNATLGRGGAS